MVQWKQLQLVPYLTLFNSPHNILIYLDPKFSERRNIEVTRKHWLGIRIDLKSLFAGNTLANSTDHWEAWKNKAQKRIIKCQLSKQQEDFVSCDPIRFLAIEKHVKHNV